MQKFADEYLSDFSDEYCGDCSKCIRARDSIVERVERLYRAAQPESTPPTRPNCDYTGAPALDSTQLCRCGTCQLYAKILFNWLAGAAQPESTPPTLTQYELSLRGRLSVIVRALERILDLEPMRFREPLDYIREVDAIASKALAGAAQTPGETPKFSDKTEQWLKAVETDKYRWSGLAIPSDVLLELLAAIKHSPETPGETCPECHHMHNTICMCKCHSPAPAPQKEKQP